MLQAKYAQIIYLIKIEKKYFLEEKKKSIN